MDGLELSKQNLMIIKQVKLKSVLRLLYFKKVLKKYQYY